MPEQSPPLPPVEYQREFNKLRPTLNRLLFTRELHDQCCSALECFGMMEEMRGREPSADALFTLAHGFLAFAGNVSKILTPRSSAVPAHLRQLGHQMCTEMGLSASDLEVIFAPRNNLEHFHEKMDKYLKDIQAKSPFAQIVFQSVVCVTEDDKVARFDADTVFYKLLISSTWKITICGRVHDLAALRSVIDSVARAARRSVESLEATLAEHQARLQEMFELDGYPPRLRATPAG